jgi:hypothetical protein
MSQIELLYSQNRLNFRSLYSMARARRTAA